MTNFTQKTEGFLSVCMDVVKGVFGQFSSFGLDEGKKDTLLHFSSGPVHVHTGFLQPNQEA